MKNTIISIFICLILGLTMSFYLFKQYDAPAAKEIETVSFLQIAVYSSLESLQQNININQYIYSEEKDGFHVYVAITKNNQELLTTFFKNKGFDVYIKDMIITNQDFIKEVENADLLLKELKDDNSIMALIRQVLERYEQI